jgi:UDP-glucose 4-epimerase
MRVLVTGGAGFIGSHVVDALRAAGHEPRVFDLRASPHHPEDEVDTVIGSVLDPRSLRAAMEDCQAVAHLAAAADVDDVAKRPAEAEELNARGTLNVLEAARGAGVGRVLYASTIWVYGGRTEDGTADEETPLGSPDHLYTATKLGGEMYCRSYSKLFGLDYTILRFGIPYGPRARPTAVIPALVGKALDGEPLTIAGTGEQSRRFVYVEDLAKGVVAALRPEAANRVYNLAGSEDVSVKQIAETVRELIGGTQIVHTPPRVGDFGGVEVSTALAQRELGWRDSTPFAEGLRRYVDWHRRAAPPSLTPRVPSMSLGSVADRIASVGLFIGAVALLAAYFVALHSVAGEDTTRSVVLASMGTLVLYTALARDRGVSRGVPARALMWIVVAAGALALVAPGPRGLLDLARPDLVVLLLCMGGGGFAVALAASGRRLVPRSPPEERSQDSGT